MSNVELVERLREIQGEMLELLDEAKGLVRQSGNRFECDRAKAYWLAHCQMALTNDHDYLGSSGCSLEDTINALDDGEEEEEGEEEE